MMNALSNSIGSTGSVGSSENTFSQRARNRFGFAKKEKCVGTGMILPSSPYRVISNSTTTSCTSSISSSNSSIGSIGSQDKDPAAKKSPRRLVTTLSKKASLPSSSSGRLYKCSNVMFSVCAVGLFLMTIQFLFLAAMMPGPGDYFGHIRHRDRSLLEHQASQEADYICLGFRTTDAGGNSHSKAMDMKRTLRYSVGLVGINGRQCSEELPEDEPGYCELRHRKTGEFLTVSSEHPNVHKMRDQFGKPYFRCENAFSLHQCKEEAKNFALDPFVKKIQDSKGMTTVDIQEEVEEAVDQHSQRGLVIKVKPSTLPSTYALIQMLRKEHKCTLPIELWTHIGEVGLDFEPNEHPLMKELLEDPSIYYRTVWDFRFSGYMSTAYMIAYSNFDQVLYLDNHNFPARDPSYLFDSPEFQSNSAVFWKDYWSPDNDEFVIKPNSLLHALIAGTKEGTEFQEDIMEPELRQLLVDRRKSEEPLKMLLYMADKFSHWFDLLGAYGDRDLFRFAWYLADKPYHFMKETPRLPGVKMDSIGRHVSPYCDDTMIQPDPSGLILFYHRTTARLGTKDPLVKTWRDVGHHVEHHHESSDSYDTAAQRKSCYFPQDVALTSKNEDASEADKLEETILEYAHEAFVREKKSMREGEQQLKFSW